MAKCRAKSRVEDPKRGKRLALVGSQTSRQDETSESRHSTWFDLEWCHCQDCRASLFSEQSVGGPLAIRRKTFLNVFRWRIVRSLLGSVDFRLSFLELGVRVAFSTATFVSWTAIFGHPLSPASATLQPYDATILSMSFREFHRRT